MSVLQRKAQAGKQEHQARAMSVPKALRVSVAKSADDLFDLPMAVIGAVQEKCSSVGLPEKVDENGLMIFLDGPGGVTAGAVLGPEFVAALVQQQTTGRIATPPPVGRRLTATDAALCAPMIDEVFKRAHALVEEQADRDLLAPFRFGAKAESKRVFLMSLDVPDYQIVRLTVDVAAGAIQTVLVLLLPVIERPAEREAALPEGTAPGEGARLEKAVMGLQAELWAVLAKVRLPLSRLERLAPGDVVGIPLDAFDKVQLVARDGRRIGQGVMGQIDGKRALQVDHRPVDAGKPQRRASDRDDIDQVPVAPLSSEKTSGKRAVPAGDSDFDDDLSDLPAIDITPVEESENLTGPDDLPDLSDLPEFSDLPELDDFDDIDDLLKMTSA
jgi:flagellar motor switch/type III secretory pathway protein FliN